MISARRAAYNALTAVTKDGAYTALALKESIPAGMPGEDKKFAALLARTTLENLIRIDYVLDKFIKSGRVHGSVRNIMRLGACQIMFMGTESYAAVSESLFLIKQIKPQMSGFVNAVLRSLSRGIGSIEYPAGENAKALSIAFSYPLWICEKYIADFGYQFTKELMSHKAPRGTAIRMNTLRTNTDEFERELNKLGFEFIRGNVENSYIVYGMSDIENLGIFKKGWLAVQSESSMRSVLQTEIGHGMKLLDCCAAPGGKSAYAAALAQNTLEIIAWDIHVHRVEMMEKNFERMRVKNAKALLHDANEFEQSLEEAFDVVMVDAPCSAMGLMAKNPDIRYNRNMEDVNILSKKQYDILSICSKYVKIGGTLAYYTCSVNKEENEQITDKFIAGNTDFEYKKEPETLYPQLCGSNGFYIAIMKRKI